MQKRVKETSEVIDNLRRLFQAVNGYAASSLQSTGLTGPQLWALKILARNAPLRLSELSRQMYLRPATVVGIIDRLEMKGLVTRTRSMKDRRAVDLVLSEKGEGVVLNAPEVAQTMLLKGLESLTDEDFQSVVVGMELLVRILGAEHVTPQPLH